MQKNRYTEKYKLLNDPSKGGSPYLKMALATLFLFTIPVIFWVFGYQWNIEQNYSDAHFLLLLITESGSAPIYAGISSIFFTALLFKQYRRFIDWKFLLLIILIIHGGAQIAKTVLKASFQEARPYTAILVNQGVKTDAFYREKAEVRAKIIKQSVVAYDHVPKWLKSHWQAETGYSFPSGHTAFAVAWLMVFVICLGFRITLLNMLITLFIGTWASLMLVSRVLLGMHFPIDLFVSIALVFGISCLAYQSVIKFFSHKTFV